MLFAKMGVLHGVISTKEVLAISNKDANVEDVMKRRLVVALSLDQSVVCQPPLWQRLA